MGGVLLAEPGRRAINTKAQAHVPLHAHRLILCHPEAAAFLEITISRIAYPTFRHGDVDDIYLNRTNATREADQWRGARERYRYTVWVPNTGAQSYAALADYLHHGNSLCHRLEQGSVNSNVPRPNKYGV